MTPPSQLPTRRPACDVIEDVATRLEDAMETGDVHVVLPGCILALRVVADLERKGIA